MLSSQIKPFKVMQNLLARYKALSTTNKVGVVVCTFTLAILLLPNTIVYAAGSVVAYKLIDRKGWKYVTSATMCFVTLISALLWVARSAPPTQVANSVDLPKMQEQKVKETVATTTSTSTAVKAKTEKPAVQTKVQDKLAQPPSSQYTYYSVTEVVDGDTIKISMEGKVETLRLIGMDTPETVDPRKPVQCFGKEASSKAKELLSGRKVRIETDPTQGERDKYDRLLAYIYRDDGLLYNKYMIEQGYAHEYTYNIPYKYQVEFKAAQKSAQTAQLGLWSPSTCNGDTTSSNTGTQTPPAASSQSTGKYYTSSHYSSKYYYPEACDEWKTLSPSYLRSYDTLEALLEVYPSRTTSPQCG